MTDPSARTGPDECGVTTPDSVRTPLRVEGQCPLDRSARVRGAADGDHRAGLRRGRPLGAGGAAIDGCSYACCPGDRHSG
jgi:hypothetical protein